MENKKVRGSGNSKVRSRKLYGLRGLKRVVRGGASTVLLKMLSTVLKIGGEEPRYENVVDGDKVAIAWKETGLNLCCCDCALVHYVTFEVVDEVIVMQLWRNEEETELCRSMKGIKVEVVNARDGD